MGAQQSLPASDERARFREFQSCINDIVIRQDGREDESLHLTELCLFGIRGHDDGMCVPVSEVTPTRWEADGAFEVDHDREGVECILKGRGGWDVAFVYLPCESRGGIEIDEDDLSIRVQDVYTLDDEVHLIVAWHLTDVAPEHLLSIDNHLVVPAPNIVCNYHPALDPEVLQEGIKVFVRAQATQSVSDLGQAISITENALRVATEGHPMHPLLLSNLGAILLTRFHWIGAIEDLDRATEALSTALQAIPLGHSNIPVLAQNLGVALTEQYERSGDYTLIERAISAFQTAIIPTRHGRISTSVPTSKVVESVTVDSGEQALGSLMSLGSALRVRFEHSGDLQDATDQVAIYRQCLALTPPWDPSVSQITTRLGSALAHVYAHSGRSSDIDEAIALHRQAVTLTLGRDPEPMGDLGKAFHVRFGRTGNLPDIDEAIHAHRIALGLLQPDDSSVPAAHANLGASLVARFRDTGNLRDAAEAIAALHQAVDISPQSPRSLAFILENLSICFLLRFEHTTEDSDISESILSIRRAVKLTEPPTPNRLSILGNALSLRFTSSGDQADINEAISTLQKTVSLTRETDSNLPRHLTNLGASFIQRYKSTGEVPDINAAISELERAVTITQEGHADLPVRLDHLGSAQSLRLLHDVDLVQRARDIAALGPSKDITEFPTVNEGICVIYESVGKSLQGDPETKDYEERNNNVINILQKAVDLTPDRDAMLSSRLTHLSWGLQRRFMISGDRTVLTALFSVLKRAATCVSSPPHDRLTAASHWAEMLTLEWPSSEMIPAFGTAMDLLALVAGLERSIELRHSQLREVATLPLRAAVAACELGRLDKAIEWLEQGRSLVWRQLTHLRTPLDALRASDPELADKIARVSKRLEVTGASRRSPDTGMTQSERFSLQAEARKHLQLAQQWDELLVQARALPDFENFLKPTPYPSIVQHLPDSGPIVVINVHRRHCDALALLCGSDEPLHIPLPNFSYQKAKKYQKDLANHLERQGFRSRALEDGELETSDSNQSDDKRPIARFYRTLDGNHDTARAVLKCLWVEVVKPILDALGFSNAKESPHELLPRIWWCPTGPLSFLPIHAAGIYSETLSECLFDYAVSSTVSAITDRVKTEGTRDHGKCGLLLTSQPKPPGAARIAGTTKEVVAIHAQALDSGVRALKFDGDELSVEDCLENMSNFSCIHLACHASQNASRPLESRFLFHTGRLKLNDIMLKDLKHADLAFLSACQTSTGEATLSEEAVHLAAGMLAAGYRRVVATMWSINDGHAPEVAKDFYEYLWSHRDEASGSHFDGSRSAHALHYAIQKLRHRLKGDQEQALLAWVPYVHFGS